MLPHCLQVIDLDGEVCLPTDLHCLIYRLQQLFTLGAQVGDVDATIPAYHLRNLDKLPCGGICIGRIDEGIGDAECSILHCFCHHAPHLLQFIGGGRAHVSSL